MAHVLVIDNYDSFVYNIVQYLAQLGAEVEVWRNDDPRLLRDDESHNGNEALLAAFDGILLSPGPGRPEDAGACIDIIDRLAGKVPIFGVCLGLQAMAVAWGGGVGRAPEQLHGKTSLVHHDGKGVFAGLPNPFTATRYHSLAIDPQSVPGCLVVTATTDTGVIMGIRHSEHAVEAVQFHPESVLTECGYQLLANWLSACGACDALDRARGLSPLLELR